MPTRNSTISHTYPVNSPTKNFFFSHATFKFTDLAVDTDSQR